MGGAGGAQDADADGRVRARRPAGRGGDDDPGDLPVARVVLYHAAGCHLCDRARGVLDGEGVDYEAVDVTGDAELEARYREWLPVVEIDGARAFVYYVDPPALRRKLAAAAQTS